MRESLRIIYQCLNQIPDGPVKSYEKKVSLPPRASMKNNMEVMIHHFKTFALGYTVPEGVFYTYTEAPKGEFGVFLYSNNSNRPYRIKFKSPGFIHLQSLGVIGVNINLADMVTLIGTIDIVFGEVDR
jgi:NADH:ubiquinone oxidoreductase subunit D